MQPSIMRNLDLAVLILLMTALLVPVAAQALPGDFVYLHDVDPSIVQDIRYAGVNNFAGRPIAGYAAECVVKRAVALALQNVQRELAVRKLSLKMLDCYRPVVAKRQRNSGRAALQSCFQETGPVPAGLYRQPFPAFHRRRGRSYVGRSQSRQFSDL
jgi:D-alanyl-D-alanine dipeptidase